MVTKQEAADPTIYRFYEVVQVYGPTIKELIHEEFGDGIMSAINFRFDVKRVPRPSRRPRGGDPGRQVPALPVVTGPGSGRGYHASRCAGSSARRVITASGTTSSCRGTSLCGISTPRMPRRFAP